VLASHARRPGDLAARYGGEEFTLLLPGTDPAGALARVRSAAEEVQRLGIPHEGSPFKVVTISAGVASCGKGREDIVTAADRALYAAKASGRNSVRQSE
jgi:diguanylate cyclase (GGDEF)-like protein